jgi:tRNA pseudouridine55 synthase
MDFEKGEVLLFDKPIKWTSFDLVRKVRFVTRVKKVGHAGTLDPLATGLLILCTGKKTRDIDQIQGQEKEYTGTFFLGGTTPCYDREKPVDQTYPTEHITVQMIHDAAKSLTGNIQQLPPPFSAIRIGGKRAYDLARQGKEVPMEPRMVEVKEFEITSVEMPLVGFRVVCSKGTYIRSLASDIGKLLNSGAHLYSLKRTRIGNYRLEDAWNMDAFMEAAKVARKSLNADNQDNNDNLVTPNPQPEE